MKRSLATGRARPYPPFLTRVWDLDRGQTGIARQRACHPERSESARGIEGSRAASFCRVICCGFTGKDHHGRKGGREILRVGGLAQDDPEAS